MTEEIEQLLEKIDFTDKEVIEKISEKIGPEFLNLILFYWRDGNISANKKEQEFKQTISLTSSEVYEIVKNMDWRDADDFQEFYLEDLEKEGILTFQPSSLAEKMEFEKWRDTM